VSASAKRGVTILFTAALLLLAALSFHAGQQDISGPVPISVDIGGPFTLIDQFGKTRREAEFHGKLMLIYFGYTQCQELCSTELQTMSATLDLMGERQKEVQPLFITVDPLQDTPEALKAFIANFTPRLLALSGTEAQIDVAEKAYHIYTAKVQRSDGSRAIDHSSFIYLMGRDGKYLAHFGMSETPEGIARAIAKFL